MLPIGGGVGGRSFDKPHDKIIGIAVPKWKPFPLAIQTFVTVVCELYWEETLKLQRPRGGEMGEGSSTKNEKRSQYLF